MKLLFSARTWFVLSGLFIFYATTIPWDLAHAPSLDRVQWIPGWDAARSRIWSIPDMVQNVVLFLPFGFFGFVGLPVLRRRGVVGGSLLAGALGLSLSLFVECLQTMSAVRSPSATDLATNFAGALIGGATAGIYVAYLEARLVRALFQTARERPGILILLAYFVAITLGSLAPFIPTLDLSTVWGNLKALRADPWGPKSLGQLVTDGLLFGALAFLMTQELPALLARHGYIFKTKPISRGRAAAFSALLTATLALGLEAAQLIILGHSPGLSDAVVGAVFAAAGASLAALLARDGLRTARRLGALTRRTPWLVLGFAVLAPATRALAPFEFVSIREGLSQISAWQFAPFWALFRNLNISTFRNVFEVAAFYLPLGYAIYALGYAPRFSFFAGFLLAEILEGLQIIVRGRVFDVTEGIYAGLMGLVGAWILASLGESAAKATPQNRPAFDTAPTVSVTPSPRPR